jgi:hypothetical protein
VHNDSKCCRPYAKFVFSVFYFQNEPKLKSADNFEVAVAIMLRKRQRERENVFGMI